MLWWNPGFISIAWYARMRGPPHESEVFSGVPKKGRRRKRRREIFKNKTKNNNKLNRITGIMQAIP